MKFLIKNNCDVYTHLRELYIKIENARKAAGKVCKKVGASDFATGTRRLAGGIDGFSFDKKPEGYRTVGESWQNLYYPTVALLKKDRNLATMLNNLPVLDHDELNNIVKFKAPQTVTNDGGGLGIAMVYTVGIFWGKDYILMQTHPGTKYKPIPGIVEIKESEFDKLKAKIKGAE